MNTQQFEQLLEQCGINQNEFCRQVELTPHAVSKWKRTKTFPAWVDGWLKGKLCQQELERVRGALNVLREIESK
jgi:DNA-binding XRE family transcriptional regulator